MHHVYRWVALVIAAGLASSTLGCRADEMGTMVADEPSGIFAPAPRVPGGTTLVVRLGRTVSSASVAPGDPWRGMTTTRVLAGDRVLVPEGAEVSGTVAGVRAAHRGDAAMVHLKVRSIVVNGRTMRVDADAEPIVKGYQIVMKEGTVLTFTTNDAVALR
jgi:hypothetical protein